MQYLKVDTPKLLEALYRFRYQILCEELGFFPKEKYPDGLESDEYDPYSEHYVALEDNEIVATVRFIHDSPISYPTPNHLHVCPIIQNFLKNKKLGEVSRIFIKKRYRNFKTTRKLMEEFVKPFMYRDFKKFKVEYSYGAMERSFIRLLQRWRVPHLFAGPLQSGYGSPRYPSILSTKQMGLLNPAITKGA